MIRLILLLYRRRNLRYAVQRCREMRDDAAHAELHFAEQLQHVEAEIAVERMDRRYKVRT